METAAVLVEALVAATTWEIVFAIVAALALVALWLIALFLIVLDDLSGGAKAAWLVVCVLLAPVAVPLYLILRTRRHARTDTA